MVPRLPRPEYENFLATIDIALDTFPYHGTATTCDALSAGIPVIVQEGSSHLSRVGVSLLRSIGCEELIAFDREDYVRQAVKLAKDPEGLTAMHTAIMNQTRGSFLVDGASLTRELEQSLRRAWHA